MQNQTKSLRVRDKAKWERVGMAIEDFVGSGCKFKVRKLCREYNIAFSTFMNYYRKYKGIDEVPVIVTLSADKMSGIDLMNWHIEQMK